MQRADWIAAALVGVLFLLVVGGMSWLTGGLVEPPGATPFREDRSVHAGQERMDRRARADDHQLAFVRR